MSFLLNSDSLLVSTGIVALAEVGDKTQLLSLILAARFQKPWPIILGILVATLANHFLAALLGTWITTALTPDTLAWILGLSFIAMAVWMLIPDTFDDADTHSGRYGVFGATLIAFFLAEMGDKTQLATIALAAQYQALPSVVAGTTLGMMIANVPVVFLGEKLAHRLPVRPIHLLAALLFAALGVIALAGSTEFWATLQAFVSRLRIVQQFKGLRLLDTGLMLVIATVLGMAQNLGTERDNGYCGGAMALFAAAFMSVTSYAGSQTETSVFILLGSVMLMVALLGAVMLVKTGITRHGLAQISTLTVASATGAITGAGLIGEAVVISGCMFALNRWLHRAAAPRQSQDDQD